MFIIRIRATVGVILVLFITMVLLTGPIRSVDSDEAEFMEDRFISRHHWRCIRRAVVEQRGCAPVSEVTHEGVTHIGDSALRG